MDINQKVLKLLEIIKNYNGKLSYTAFCRLACEAGLFEVVKDFGILFMRVVDEHNDV